jgi:hypothetical protein
MMKPLLAAFAAASIFALGACTQETRVEDDSAERQMERAGNELEQAADEAGDRIERAGERVEEGVQDATDGNPNTNP